MTATQFPAIIGVWCSGAAGIGQPAEFNPDLLRDQTRSLLASYLRGVVSVFHCPADVRIGTYQGSDPSLIGKTVPAARTFSMNQAVGTICPGFDSQPEVMGKSFPPHFGAPSLPVNGPWLNSLHTHRRDSPWITYGKMSTVRAPGPSSLWVLVDENVTYLNDAAFAFGMEIPQWHDAGKFIGSVRETLGWEPGKTKADLRPTPDRPHLDFEVRRFAVTLCAS